MLVLRTSFSCWHCRFLFCDTLLPPGLWDTTAFGMGISVSVYPLWRCLFFLCLWVGIVQGWADFLITLQASPCSVLFCQPWLQLLGTTALLLGKSRSIVVISLLGSRTQHLISIMPKTHLIFLLNLLFPLHFLSLQMALPCMQSWKTKMLQCLHVPLLLLFPP